MTISLAAFAKELQSTLTGVAVEHDTKTDNLVVHDGERGFCITRRYLQDHDIVHVKTLARETVDALQAMRSNGPDGAKFYTVAAIKEQRTALMPSD